MKKIVRVSALLGIAAGALLFFSRPPAEAYVVENGSPRIAWYGKLSDGIAEAKRSNRPILLVAAAPQCEGVSGLW